MPGPLPFWGMNSTPAASRAVETVKIAGTRCARSAPHTGMRTPFRIVEREGYFKVEDARGYGVAAVYFDDSRAGDLTWDEARRIAANIAKLPDLGPSREAPTPEASFRGPGAQGRLSRACAR